MTQISMTFRAPRLGVLVIEDLLDMGTMPSVDKGVLLWLQEHYLMMAFSKIPAGQIIAERNWSDYARLAYQESKEQHGRLGLDEYLKVGSQYYREMIACWFYSLSIDIVDAVYLEPDGASEDRLNALAVRVYVFLSKLSACLKAAIRFYSNNGSSTIEAAGLDLINFGQNLMKNSIEQLSGLDLGKRVLSNVVEVVGENPGKYIEYQDRYAAMLTRDLWRYPTLARENMT